MGKSAMYVGMLLENGKYYGKCFGNGPGLMIANPQKISEGNVPR